MPRFFSGPSECWSYHSRAVDRVDAVLRVCKSMPFKEIAHQYRFHAHIFQRHVHLSAFGGRHIVDRRVRILGNPHPAW